MFVLFDLFILCVGWMEDFGCCDVDVSICMVFCECMVVIVLMVCLCEFV